MNDPTLFSGTPSVEPNKDAPNKQDLNKQDLNKEALDQDPPTTEEIRAVGEKIAGESGGESKLGELYRRLIWPELLGRRVGSRRERMDALRKLTERASRRAHEEWKKATVEQLNERLSGPGPDRPLAYAEEALYRSRNQWPPVPRRGDRYSETQMKEAVETAAFGLPIRQSMIWGIAEAKRKLKAAGMPESLLEGPRKWDLDGPARSAARRLESRLQQRGVSGTRKIDPTQEAVAEVAEEVFFEPLEGEIRLLRWACRQEDLWNEDLGPTWRYRRLRKMKEIGPTVSSPIEIAKKVLYAVDGVTLGKTTFGSSRKTPAYAGRANYDKDIPRLHDLWRGRAEVGFGTALRRRREYERAIEEAEQSAHAASNERFLKGLKDVLYPFFRWYVGNGYSITHLATVSRKWEEWTDPGTEPSPNGKEQYPEEDLPTFGRNDISERLEFRGGALGRVYAPPLTGRGEEVPSLISLIGHLRRRVALAEEVTWERQFRMVDRAKSDAERDVRNGKDLQDLYDAVEELIIDQALQEAGPAAESPTIPTGGREEMPDDTPTGSQ